MKTSRILTAVLALSGLAWAQAGPGKPAPGPTVKLAKSERFQPDSAPLPAYPQRAKEEHVEGDVSAHFQIGSSCATEEITIDNGPQLLKDAVEEAVKDWKYCGVPEGEEIQVVVSFRLN